MLQVLATHDLAHQQHFVCMDSSTTTVVLSSSHACTLNLLHAVQVGPLPASWSGLNNLKVLGLRDNRLLGALPTSYGKMQNLQYM
jgi:hypothetical protein